MSLIMTRKQRLEQLVGAAAEVVIRYRMAVLQGAASVAISQLSALEEAYTGYTATGPKGTSPGGMEQDAPVRNQHPAVWDLVQVDMKERDWTGAAKYGTRLQPHNGRDALIDAYQEALDLVVYLRQAIYEWDGS
jgi:hypothetical protein